MTSQAGPITDRNGCPRGHTTRAIDAGATGYPLKDTRRDQLFHAIRSAARGGSVLSPAVAEGLSNADIARRRHPRHRAAAGTRFVMPPTTEPLDTFCIMQKYGRGSKQPDGAPVTVGRLAEPPAPVTAGEPLATALRHLVTAPGTGLPVLDHEKGEPVGWLSHQSALQAPHTAT